MVAFTVHGAAVVAVTFHEAAMVFVKLHGAAVIMTTRTHQAFAYTVITAPTPQPQGSMAMTSHAPPSSLSTPSRTLPHTSTPPTSGCAVTTSFTSVSRNCMALRTLALLSAQSLHEQ